MTTPQIVVFDLGKVLIDFDYGIVAGKMAGQSTLPAAEIRQFIDHSPLLYRFETGLLTGREMFEQVRALTGFRGTFGEFCDLFCNIFTPIEPMIASQAQLRARGVPTFIFSNTNQLQLDHIRQTFPFFQQFDGYVLSFEHGAMKPDPRIYEVVERMTGRHGSDILYLDDRVENARAGVARNWQVVHHHSPERTIPMFEELGLLPPR